MEKQVEIALKLGEKPEKNRLAYGAQ